MCFILSVFLFIKAMSKLAELIRLQLVGVRVDFVFTCHKNKNNNNPHLTLNSRKGPILHPTIVSTVC